MPCPKCGCNALWDDNLAWGCTKCSFMSADGMIVNRDSRNDYFPQDRPKVSPEIEPDYD